MKEMLQSFWDHKWSSIFGVLGGALGATALVENLDKMSTGQVAMAFLGSLLFALKGLVSADAKPAVKQ